MTDAPLAQTPVRAKRGGRPTYVQMMEKRRLAHLERVAADEVRFQIYLDTMPLEEGVCYFFGAAEGIVKIGHSRNIIQRFNRIKSGSLYRLDIIAVAPGSSCRERHYHNRFREHGMGGEWFRRAPEIEAEIDALNERFPVQDMLLALGCAPRDCVPDPAIRYLKQGEAA